MREHLDILRERWRVAALKASAARNRAEELEEARKVLLDEMTIRLTKAADDDPRAKTMPIAAAERIARTSDQFKSLLRKMHDAKREAQDLQIEAKNAEMHYYEVVGAEAHERAEMRMTGAAR